MNLLLTVVLIGTMEITAYRSTPAQTDNSPFTTSIGERVHPHGVALSRNLLKRWGGPLNYGDFIYIEGIGFKVVNDTMHERNKDHIDVWVKDFNEEKDFDQRFRNKKVRLWLVIPKLEVKSEKRISKRYSPNN